MRKDQFIQFMDAPEKITGSSIALLDGLVKEFPYCQTAQLLLAKGLNNDNSIRYGNQLKIAAAYAADRKVLYQLIMRKPQAAVTEEKQEAADTLVMPDNDDELLNNLVISAEENKPEEQEEKSSEPAKEEPAITEIPTLTQEIKEAAAEERTVTEEKIEKPLIPAKEEITPGEEPETTVPELPPLEKNIIVKAIDASIELEVSENMPFKENGETGGAETPETPGSETLKPEVPGTEKPGTEKQEIPGTENEDFDPNTTHSFTEWLKHAKKAKASEEKEQQEEFREQEPAVQPKKRTRKDIDDLIDKFISEEPKISRPSAKQDFFSPVNKARQSVKEDDEYVTETLANIYLKQGSYAKALKTYETLSLKFPEKKLYFAARIKEIKKIIKEQK